MLLLTSTAAAEEKLERGNDRIIVPATSPGLILHNLFQSGMIIQRDKPIRIWGWADPGETITVAFAEQSRTAMAAKDRRWMVEFNAEPASTQPKKITIQGQAKTIACDNILIGDVWLLGGQSNMEFEIAKVDGGQLEIASANFPNIRLFTVPQQNGPDIKAAFPVMDQWSDFFGQHFRQGEWNVCSPQTVREMSAIGYIFARRLHMATQIPIGIIDASRGGTCLETWTPIEVLSAMDAPEVRVKLAEWNAKVVEFDPKKDLENRIRGFHDRQVRLKAQGQEPKGKPPTELLPGPGMDMNRPGNCYASMISPLIGISIKGAIWHQGFSNALELNGHVLYKNVFPKMITAWRAAFQDPKLPFGIISLCTEGDPQDHDDYLEKMDNEGIYIRTVQYHTFRDLRNAGDTAIGYASSYDQRRSWYHPQIKIPLGERIAQWALATQYGMSKSIRWLPPMLQETRIEPGRIVLQFDCPVGPYHDGPIEGFAVAGKDGRFQLAQAEWLTTKDKKNQPQQDRTTIVLTSAMIPSPVYFRHAWGRNPLANLKSMDHTNLPVPTLRNDPFTIADMFEIYSGKKSAKAHVLDSREHGVLKTALRGEDLKRRVAEAKALLEKHGQSPNKP
jgi:sialate O-acetylesterase